MRCGPRPPALARVDLRTGSLASVTEVTETVLTPETHARLVAELEDLTTRGRVEIARQIEAARALGDLSENGDYHAAKDAQGKMESRIRQLQQMLSSAVIVGAAPAGDGVAAGSIVGIRYGNNEDVERFLLGSIEERRDDVAVISIGSPLGRALLGHRAGEHITYEAPNGRLEVEVVTVD